MNELIELLLSAINDEWRSSVVYEAQSATMRGLWKEPLSEHFTDHAEEEESHAERLTQHLFSRGIEPEIHLPDFSIGKTLEDMIRLDLQLEIEAIDKYIKIIQLCEQDPSLMDTKLLVEDILVDEIHHSDDLACMLKTKIKSKEEAIRSASLLSGLIKTATRLDQIGCSEADSYDQLTKIIVETLKSR